MQALIATRMPSHHAADVQTPIPKLINDLLRSGLSAHSVMPALQRLPKEILEKPEFESYFVGAESKIDQVLSSTWLKQHTKHWTWKNYIMANTPR